MNSEDTTITQTNDKEHQQQVMNTVFYDGLWQKIHESIVLDLCQEFDQAMEALSIACVQKETTHPSKSLQTDNSCADILLSASDKWEISNPSQSTKSDDEYDEEIISEKFWIDVQLKWGEFNVSDITEYTRSKFMEYTSDNMSIYPSATGCVIGIDLANDTYSAFGNWFTGCKELIQNAMNKIMKVNSALSVLRDRIRKDLPDQSKTFEKNFTFLPH